MLRVSPSSLRWARERARLDVANLIDRFPYLDAWEFGIQHPTPEQLVDFARAVDLPLRYLLLHDQEEKQNSS